MSLHRDGRVNDPTTDSRSDAQTDTSTLGGPSSGIANDPSDLWDALGSRRRRQTVRYLATHEDVQIGDVAEHIAALENDCAPAELDSDQRKRVYIGLHQTHLGELDAADVVDWNKARQTIERDERFVEAHKTVETVADITAGTYRDERESTGLRDRLRSYLGRFR